MIVPEYALIFAHYFLMVAHLVLMRIQHPPLSPRGVGIMMSKYHRVQNIVYALAIDKDLQFIRPNFREENALPRRRRKRRLSAGNELNPETEMTESLLPRMSLTAVSSVDCPPSLSAASPIQIRLERSGLSWADFLYLFIVIAIIYWFYNHMSHHHCTADHHPI